MGGRLAPCCRLYAICGNRAAALNTARMEAVTMFACRPTPSAFDKLTQNMYINLYIKVCILGENHASYQLHQGPQ